MKKGCLTPLLIGGAAAAVYWIILRGRMDSPAHGLVSLGGGLMMWMAVEQLRIAKRWLDRAGKIGAPSAIAQRPSDGDEVAITGTIRATGPTLTAPFSGTDAVLFSAAVREPGPDNARHTPLPAYQGFALTPSVVDSNAGAFRLLGFPLVPSAEAARLDGVSARANAEAWIATTTFTDLGGQPAAMFREMKELATDDDGEVKKFWRLREERDISRKTLIEYAVRPGEQVCVVGRYSAQKNGIEPGPSGPVQLLRGDPRSVARTMRRKAVGGAVLFALLTAITNGALLAVVTARG